MNLIRFHGNKEAQVKAFFHQPAGEGGDPPHPHSALHPTLEVVPAPSSYVYQRRREYWQEMKKRRN